MEHRASPSPADAQPPLASRAPTEGEPTSEAAARAAVAADFGHLVHRDPAGVAHPRSSHDLQASIRWAGQQGLGLAPRGRGHSVFGRSQVEGGVVADLSALDEVEDVRADSVVVGAGATWSGVLDATLPHGLTPPVLTDYLDLTVGGTLAVGGVGGASSELGLQVDHLLALQVVTGAGHQLTCTPGHNRDLFDAVRGGLGQAAVLTKVMLRLHRAPGRVRRFLLSYPDLPSMLADERRLHDEQRFDALQGAILPSPEGGWAFRIEAAAYAPGEQPGDRELLDGLSDDPSRRGTTTLSFREYADRLAPLEAALRANGQWWTPHPWLATFVGDSAVEAVVSAELLDLDPVRDLGHFGQIVLSPLRRAAVTAPLVRLPDEDRVFTFNLFRIPAGDDREATARLVEANRAIYDRVKAAGGTLYPVSAFPLDRAGWREHFGPAHPLLQEAKRRFDPDNLLTPGYEAFT